MRPTSATCRSSARAGCSRCSPSAISCAWTWSTRAPRSGTCRNTCTRCPPRWHGAAAARHTGPEWRSQRIFDSFDARVAWVAPTNRSRGPPPRGGRLPLAGGRALSDSSRRRAVPPRRDGSGRQALRGRADPVQEDRRAPRQLLVRVAGPLPHRPRLPSRGGVRQGHHGVRDVPELLPEPPDRRSRPARAGDDVLHQLKPIEQDQAVAAKALAAFRKLAKEYPESRYATDARAKIDICRGRLAP